jgi:hypothetical protein
VSSFGRHAFSAFPMLDGLRPPPRLYTEQSGYHRTKALLRDKFTEDELAVLVTEGHHWSHDRALDEAATMRLS